MFLKNAWYIAAWDSEIGNDPFSQIIWMSRS